jgi:hypothetical protein
MKLPPISGFDMSTSNERPACPNCGERMMLARREPHPVHGLPYEQQAFECAGCGVMVSHTVPPDARDTRAGPDTPLQPGRAATA